MQVIQLMVSEQVGFTDALGLTYYPTMLAHQRPWAAWHGESAMSHAPFEYIGNSLRCPAGHIDSSIMGQWINTY